MKKVFCLIQKPLLKEVIISEYEEYSDDGFRNSTPSGKTVYETKSFGTVYELYQCEIEATDLTRYNEVLHALSEIDKRRYGIEVSIPNTVPLRGIVDPDLLHTETEESESPIEIQEKKVCYFEVETGMKGWYVDNHALNTGAGLFLIATKHDRYDKYGMTNLEIDKSSLELSDDNTWAACCQDMYEKHVGTAPREDMAF